MRIKKLLIRTGIVLLILLAAVFTWLSFTVFPAVSGYGAKNLCSAVFIQHRNPDDVTGEDLSGFPLSLGTFTVDEKDASVTGTVLGLAERKAVYRNGCGCALVNDFPEAEIREQEFTLPPAPATGTDTLPWPYGNSITAPIPTAINREQLQQAINRVFTEAGTDGLPVFTRAVLVIYDGQLIAEQYAPGFDSSTVMLGWSISKSLTGTLIGILVKAGKLSVDAPAPVAAWNGTEKSNITIKHLLQQTSGIDFTENYSKPSSVTRMLFSKGDMAAYTASLPLKHAPGTVFNYSSGNTNILSSIIRNTVGEEEYRYFPYKALFHKINAYSFMLETDASGTYVGSSYSYATARDFARFGLLYYNNGNWNGEQLLPEYWVAASIRPSSADPQQHYGFQFWLNGYDATDHTKKWYPDVPGDMFFADGYGGQDIYIIPSEKLVVVRLGLYPINENRFLKEVIETVHH